MTNEKEFQVKQVLFSMHQHTFSIHRDGQQVYQIKGDHFGRSSSFQTMDGTELASLIQTEETIRKPWKDFEWRTQDGEHLWAIAKQDERTYFSAVDKKSISIDVVGDEEENYLTEPYKITGDRIGRKFEIFTGGVKIGTIHKKLGLRNNYSIRVLNDANEVNVLLCGIITQHIYHNDNDTHQMPEELQAKRRHSNKSPRTHIHKTHEEPQGKRRHSTKSPKTHTRKTPEELHWKRRHSNKSPRTSPRNSPNNSPTSVRHVLEVQGKHRHSIKSPKTSPKKSPKNSPTSVKQVLEVQEKRRHSNKSPRTSPKNAPKNSPTSLRQALKRISLHFEKNVDELNLN